MKRLVSIILSLSVLLLCLPVVSYAAATTDVVSCNITDGATNVSNPNLTEKVTVTFNQAMDKSTLTYSNVQLYFKGANGGVSFIPTCIIGADNKSVSYDMKDLRPNTEYSVILNEALKTADGSSLLTANLTLVTFTTGNIFVEANSENTILTNVSHGKTVSSSNSLNGGSLRELTDGSYGIPVMIDGDEYDGNGTRQFTIDLNGAYVPKAVDICIYGAYSPTTFRNIIIYGHNELGANAEMTRLGGTENSEAYYPNDVESRIFLDNDKKYKYITISKNAIFLLYEATIWASEYLSESGVASCNIFNEETNVSNPNLTEKVTVTFNQAMDSSTLNSTNVRLNFRGVAGIANVGSCTVGADGKSVSYDIKELRPYTTYNVILDKALKDASGNALLPANETFVTFTTGNIFVEDDIENTILKNVSLNKTVVSSNTISDGTIDKAVEGNFGDPITITAADGKASLTIDLSGAYVPKAVDIIIRGSYSPTTLNGITIYGHNEPGTDAEMTRIGGTEDWNTYYPFDAEFRIFLNNDNAYKYITISKNATFRFYEATVWAPVVETLGTHNFDIAALDISGDVANGFNAVANINNPSEEEVAPKLIIAAYNGEALEAVTVSEVETMYAKTNGEITVAIPAEKLVGKTVTNVKLFIFTNLNDITPVIKAKQLSVTE